MANIAIKTIEIVNFPSILQSIFENLSGLRRAGPSTWRPPYKSPLVGLGLKNLRAQCPNLFFLELMVSSHLAMILKIYKECSEKSFNVGITLNSVEIF